MTKGKYKLFGGFGLLLLFNISIGFFIYKAIINGLEIQLFIIETWLNNENFWMVMFSSGIQIFFLLLFMTQNKFLILDDYGITFVNPLLPFLRKTRKWDYYSEFRTVTEHSQYNTYEAIWLIKDNKLANRVSSFYYRNYKDIKKGIKIDYSGRLRINPFKQLFVLFGMKIN